MFDLVADVGRYPEFLPWCVAARIRSRAEAELVVEHEPADAVVAGGGAVRWLAVGFALLLLVALVG